MFAFGTSACCKDSLLFILKTELQATLLAEAPASKYAHLFSLCCKRFAARFAPVCRNVFWTAACSVNFQFWRCSMKRWGPGLKSTIWWNVVKFMWNPMNLYKYQLKFDFSTFLCSSIGSLRARSACTKPRRCARTHGLRHRRIFGQDGWGPRMRQDKWYC